MRKKNRRSIEVKVEGASIPASISPSVAQRLGIKNNDTLSIEQMKAVMRASVAQVEREIKERKA